MQAEQSILGAVLIEPIKYQDICDQLTHDDFQGDLHKKIWASFAKLDEEGKPVDLVTVIGEIGEYQYLHDLYKNTPGTDNLNHYVKMVKDLTLERRLVGAASDVLGIVRETGDIRDKIDRATTSLLNVAEIKADDGPRAASDIIPGWMDTLEERLNSPDSLIGVSTGLTDLDKLTAGLQPSDLIIIAGRPSMGKTTLAMNIADNVAIDQGKTALIFSLEMPSEALISRSVSSIGVIDQSRLRLADLSEDEWGRVTTSTSKIHKSGLIIDETSALSVLEVRARAKRQHRKTPLSLIVVDYIQLMTGKGENMNLMVSDISRGLKALAKELKVPVVALSQLNRGVDARSNKRPLMSDLRDSGAIEQDADLIAFVYRDEVYNTDTPNPGVAEIIISKQRNGKTGTVHTVFQGNYCRFVNHIGEIAKDIPTDSWVGGFNG